MQLDHALERNRSEYHQTEIMVIAYAVHLQSVLNNKARVGFELRHQIHLPFKSVQVASSPVHKLTQSALMHAALMMVYGVRYPCGSSNNRPNLLHVSHITIDQ
jgi:hypothetical protein